MSVVLGSMLASPLVASQIEETSSKYRGSEIKCISESAGGSERVNRYSVPAENHWHLEGTDSNILK